MLVNFLQNKGFCNTGDTVDIDDEKAQNLIDRGIVKKEPVKVIKKETISKSNDK